MEHVTLAVPVEIHMQMLSGQCVYGLLLQVIARQVAVIINRNIKRDIYPHIDAWKDLLLYKKHS